MEIWKAVPGWEGFYEVSSDGRVRSLTRTVRFADGRRRQFNGRICKLKVGNHGYPMALLSNGMARKGWFLVHRLVAAAFLGPCPAGQQVCHENGVRRDPRVVNLRYDTVKGNQADRRRHGTHLEGAAHHSARLSAAMVDNLRKAKGTMNELSEIFGVSRTHIWNIQNGKRRANG